MSWHLIRRVVAFVVVVLPLPVLSVDIESDPDIFHAEAISQELGGHTDMALAMLYKALRLKPLDEVITLDLLRVAALRNLRTPEQTAEFLQLDATSIEQQWLLAQLYWVNGQQTQSQIHVKRVLTASPNDPMALQLQKLLHPQDASAGAGKMWSANTRLSTFYDSNVTVLPTTDPSQQAGFRGQVDVGADVIPITEPLRLRMAGYLQVGTHLNNRAELGLYDVAAGTGVLGAEFTFPRVRVLVDGMASHVSIDGFQKPFMRQVVAAPTVRVDMGSFIFSGYGQYGFRNFLQLNAEGENNDRDGAFYTAAVHGSTHIGVVGLAIAVGMQGEITQGLEQRERGPTFRITMDTAWKSLVAMAGCSFEQRDYYRRDPTSPRNDLRISPTLALGMTMDERMRLVGSYTNIFNNSDSNYQYRRTLVQLSVEASW